MVNPQSILYTTIRISKAFHAWIFTQGKKGESYDDVLQRISGYATKDDPPEKESPEPEPTSPKELVIPSE